MKERYDGIDGLRAISCLCIIAMHIRANAFYNLPKAMNIIIASWTQFVPLFLMVSGFGMFCGYYDKFKTGRVDLNAFYSKRYKKFLPFFITLIMIDLLLERSLSHVIEGITEVTLVFGLLPNNDPEVIGVSWTLGVIFLFYMLFPFVVFLCWTKRRAWIVFGISILISLFCSIYYFTDRFVVESFAPRHNILYCAPWIIGGGIVYLNRETIKSFIQKYRYVWLAGCVCLSIMWYFVPSEIDTVDLLVIKNYTLFMPWLMYAISINSRVLSNKVMRFLSGISMELYLAQMVIFRALEKGNMIYILGDGLIGFILAWIMTVLGLILFIEIWRSVFLTVQRRWMV